MQDAITFLTNKNNPSVGQVIKMFGNTWQLTIHALSSLDHISSNSLSGSDNQQLYRINYTGSTIQDQSQLHGNHKYGRSRRCYWRDVHQNHCAVNRWGRWMYQLDVSCWVTLQDVALDTLSQSTTRSTVQLEQWLRSGPCVKNIVFNLFMVHSLNILI